MPPACILAAFVLLIAASIVLYALLDDDTAGTVGSVFGSAAILALGLLVLGRLPAHERRLVPALKRSRVGAVLMGVNIGLGLVIVSGVILVLGALVDPALGERMDDEPVDLGPGVWGPAVTIAALVVLAPLGEELVFRGLLLRGLVRRLPFGWAALVTSVVFAMAHIDAWLLANWARGIALVVVGLGLARLYRSRGYWASVAAHATVNAVAAIALLTQS